MPDKLYSESVLDWQSAELDLPIAMGATTFTSYMTFISLHFSSSTIQWTKYFFGSQKNYDIMILQT